MEVHFHYIRIRIWVRKNNSNSYTYDGGLTPTISGVSPSRGGTGTGGGTC